MFGFNVVLKGDILYRENNKLSFDSGSNLITLRRYTFGDASPNKPRSLH